MQTGLDVGVFPVKLLETYKDMGLSDNDVLNIMACLCTDTDPKRASEIRGYTSPNKMRISMQHLFDKGLIVEIGSTWDLSPLINSLTTTVQAGVFTFKPDKKKAGDKSIYYRAYDEVSHNLAGNRHDWANTFKDMVSQGYNLEDILKCITFIYSYNVTIAKGDIIKPVFKGTLRANIDKWLEKGKPELHADYSSKTVDADEVMEMINAV